MKQYEPYAYGQPRINFKPKFDWDSTDPIPGEKPKKDLTAVWHFAFEWLTVGNVLLIGVWAGNWWYHSGWWLMRQLIGRYCGWLLQMTEVGFW